MAFYFDYSEQKCGCWLKVVNHWDKRDDSTLCADRKIKSGSKLLLMETKVATHTQWRGGSEAAGEAARLMAPPPPQSYFFCLLVSDAYHVVGTTCNDRRSLRNTFEWMRALQAPSSSMVESSWRSRRLAPWKLQRICILRYLILGLILPNNRRMVMHFFMCIAGQSHRNIPKVQSFQFSSFLSEKNVHVP